MMNLWKPRGKNMDLGFFGDSVFDEFFNSPVFRKETSLMKTDIRKEGDNYVFDIDIPGFQKEDIKVSYDKGYLTVEATRNEEKNDKDKEGNYIRRERYYGSCSRTFYVGNIREEKIQANYKDGILTLSVPDHVQEEKEQKKYIDIR